MQFAFCRIGANGGFAGPRLLRDPGRGFEGDEIARKSGDITKAQHCRAEVYIENQGWLPVDPADVRKVALEEDIPVDSDKIKILRERLFGSWEMNWVGFNYARDFTLPGQQEGLIGFLMYPYAETAEGVLKTPRSGCLRLYNSIK